LSRGQAQLGGEDPAEPDRARPRLNIRLLGLGRHIALPLAVLADEMLDRVRTAGDRAESGRGAIAVDLDRRDGDLARVPDGLRILIERRERLHARGAVLALGAEELRRVPDLRLQPRGDPVTDPAPVPRLGGDRPALMGGNVRATVGESGQAARVAEMRPRSA
jgi:hypothetical protein